MNLEIRYAPRAEKQLRRLPEEVHRLVGVRLSQLAADPHPRGAVKLKGVVGMARIRVGDYRILYHLDVFAGELTVASIELRGKAYRKVSRLKS